MKLEQRNCTRNPAALEPAALAALLAEVPGWSACAGVLARRFRLPDYRATIAFVNAVARLAEEQDHHPEMTVGHTSVDVRWSTHSAGGALTDNDFFCAAKVNALYHGMTSA